MSLSSVQHQILLHLTPDLYVLQHTYDFFSQRWWQGEGRPQKGKSRAGRGEKLVYGDSRQIFGAKTYACLDVRLRAYRTN